MECSRGECERRTIGEIKRWVWRLSKLMEVFWESVPKSWCKIRSKHGHPCMHSTSRKASAKRTAIVKLCDLKCLNYFILSRLVSLSRLHVIYLLGKERID